MYGNFFQVRIILFLLQTFRGVFPVFGSDVSGCTGYTGIFLLRTFHDYLYAVSFFSHLNSMFLFRTANIGGKFLNYKPVSAKTFIYFSKPGLARRLAAPGGLQQEYINALHQLSWRISVQYRKLHL